MFNPDHCTVILLLSGPQCLGNIWIAPAAGSRLLQYSRDCDIVTEGSTALFHAVEKELDILLFQKEIERRWDGSEWKH